VVFGVFQLKLNLQLLVLFHRNPTTKEFRTIEDEIVDALIKIKAIPENHANEMHKVNRAIVL
jgi:hypothetical protein